MQKEIREQLLGATRSDVDATMEKVIGPDGDVLGQFANHEGVG